MSKKKLTKRFVVQKKESCGFADNRIYALSLEPAGLILSVQDVNVYNEITVGDSIEVTIIKK